MDFRESFSHDTSASLHRALSRRAEQSARGLDAFRKALDEAMRTFDAVVNAAAADRHDVEISTLVERLSAATTAHAQASVEVVRAEAGQALAASEGKRAESEKALAEVSKTYQETRQKLQDADEKIRSLLTTLDDRRRRHEALVTSMADLQGHADALQVELDSARQQAASATKELADLKGARLQAETAVRDAESARRQHEHARKTIERELLEVRATLDRTRADMSVLGTRLESAVSERARSETLLGEAKKRIETTEAQRDGLAGQVEQHTARLGRLEQAATDLEGARRELQIKLDAALGRETTLRVRLAGAEIEASEARAEAEAALRSAATAARVVLPSTAAASLDIDRLLAAFQELERGTSMGAVLTALTKGLGSQFARVALFGVSGNALQGSYQLGFDIDKDITKVVMPLTMESVITRAFLSGQVETATSDEGVGLPFGGASGWCMALPLALRGEAIAVIYADYGDQASSQAGLEAQHFAFAELLRRHAVPVLAKLTFDLKAWSELRDYATLLLDELEYVYGADVSGGRQNDELVERLTETLKCAREAYARRLETADVIDGGADFFEERLNTILDVKGATTFGRHLSVAAAALMSLKPALESSSSHPAAQAS